LPILWMGGGKISVYVMSMYIKQSRKNPNDYCVHDSNNFFLSRPFCLPNSFIFNLKTIIKRLEFGRLE
jgi:hypothetical protein